MTTISIRINDQLESVPVDANLADLISLLSLPELGCVFSINNVVIPRSDWKTTSVNHGDSISLFQAIAGG